MMRAFPTAVGASPYAYYYMMRNGILFWHKHASGLASWKCLRWYTCTVFRMIARSGYGRAETEAFADGLWSGLRGITGRWEPSRPSHRRPSPLRRLFAAKPALTFALMEADPKGVLRAHFVPLRLIMAASLLPSAGWPCRMRRHFTGNRAGDHLGHTAADQRLGPEVGQLCSNQIVSLVWRDRRRWSVFLWRFLIAPGLSKRELRYDGKRKSYAKYRSHGNEPEL